MKEIKIQTIAQQGRHTDIYPDEIIESLFRRWEHILRRDGKYLSTEQRAISFSIYLFHDCLVENGLSPNGPEGYVHFVAIGGSTEKVDRIIGKIRATDFKYADSSTGPRQYDASDSFDISRFKSVSELEKFLKELK